MIFIAAIPVFIYLMLIGFYFFCWSKLPDFSSMQKSLTTKVSVLVAVRNEEDNLPILTTCLKNQNFPKELLEIIFVNDNSTDRTEEVIRNSFLRGEINHQVISLSKNESGKKTAITKGVANASGDLIITTDADCRMDADWISTIVFFLRANKACTYCNACVVKSKNIF